MKAVIWDHSWGGGSARKSCARFSWEGVGPPFLEELKWKETSDPPPGEAWWVGFLLAQNRQISEHLKPLNSGILTSILIPRRGSVGCSKNITFWHYFLEFWRQKIRFVHFFPKKWIFHEKCTTFLKTPIDISVSKNDFYDFCTLSHLPEAIQTQEISPKSVKKIIKNLSVYWKFQILESWKKSAIVLNALK